MLVLGRSELLAHEGVLKCHTSEDRESTLGHCETMKRKEGLSSFAHIGSQVREAQGRGLLVNPGHKQGAYPPPRMLSRDKKVVDVSTWLNVCIPDNFTFVLYYKGPYPPNSVSP